VKVAQSRYLTSRVRVDQIVNPNLPRVVALEHARNAVLTLRSSSTALASEGNTDDGIVLPFVRQRCAGWWVKMLVTLAERPAHTQR
jgi:hypothetical protein